MKFLTYRVIIEPDENNTFHAYAPALPGCHTWGKSIEDVQTHIKEAIEVYVEDLVAAGESVKQEKSFDTFQTVVLPNPA